VRLFASRERARVIQRRRFPRKRRPTPLQLVTTSVNMPTILPPNTTTIYHPCCRPFYLLPKQRERRCSFTSCHATSVRNRADGMGQWILATRPTSRRRKRETIFVVGPVLGWLVPAAASCSYPQGLCLTKDDVTAKKNDGGHTVCTVVDSTLLTNETPTEKRDHWCGRDPCWVG
jgi:hypothetical protein